MKLAHLGSSSFMKITLQSTNSHRIEDNCEHVKGKLCEASKCLFIIRS